MLWNKKRGVKQPEVMLESLGLVMCQRTKLLGRKEDMIKKTIRYKPYYCLYYCDNGIREVFYSPEFAPKWDIKDCRDEKVKYYKISPEKEIEIKVK